ncbi:hypothetical protein O9992_18880 [Vibrio lentus]|nr:hypothetical protein [Vibrio lentus]
MSDCIINIKKVFAIAEALEVKRFAASLASDYLPPNELDTVHFRGRFEPTP